MSGELPIASWNNVSTTACNDTSDGRVKTGLCSSNELNLTVISILVPSCIVLVVCSVVVFIMLRVHEMRTATNLLFLNAATGDWLRGILGIAATVLYIRPIQYNETNEIICTIFYAVHFSQGFVSFWSIAALTYDRYDLLMRPLNRSIGGKQIAFILTFIWISAAAFALLPLIGWSQYRLFQLPHDPTKALCLVTRPETNAFDESYMSVYDICAYVVPVILIIVCYGKIVLMVRRQNQKQTAPGATVANIIIENTRAIANAAVGGIEISASRRQTGLGSIAAEEHHDTPQSFVRSKVFKTVTAVVCTNLLLTLPWVLLLELETHEIIVIKTFPNPLKASLQALFYCNFVVNSVIYVFWLRNTLRITARGQFRETRIATVRFVNRWCL